MTTPLEPSYALDISQTLVAYDFSGRTVVVEGNPTSIDILKEFLIEQKSIHAIRVYEHKKARRQVAGPKHLSLTESMIYAKLKEMRGK